MDFLGRCYMLIASASYRVNLFNRLIPKGDHHLISPYSNSGARRDQAKKIWMYDRTTVRPHKVLLLTCVVNCTAGTATPRLCPVVQWSVHRAPSPTTRFLVLAGARRCAHKTCGKKMRGPL